MNTLFQKMRNNRMKLEKARDIADADPMALYTDKDGRLDALTAYIAGGRRIDGNGGFVHGGARVTIVRIDEGGKRKAFEYPGPEYNRALAAGRAMNGNNPTAPAPTSPEPTHQTTWYKPSTWF